MAIYRFLSTYSGSDKANSVEIEANTLYEAKQKFSELLGPDQILVSTSMKIAEKWVVFEGQQMHGKKIQNSVSGTRSSAPENFLGNSFTPTIKNPPLIIALWCFSSLVALSTFLYLVKLDYSYISSESISIIVASSFLINIFFLSISTAMSYLHRISALTEITAGLIKTQLDIQRRKYEDDTRG